MYSIYSLYSMYSIYLLYSMYSVYSIYSYTLDVLYKLYSLVSERAITRNKLRVHRMLTSQPKHTHSMMHCNQSRSILRLE